MSITGLILSKFRLMAAVALSACALQAEFPSVFSTRTVAEVVMTAEVVDGVMELSAASDSALRSGVVEVGVDQFGEIAGTFGVRFQVKGSTPDGFASITASRPGDNSLIEAYEHIYPVSGTWQTVTLYWEDFTQNLQAHKKRSAGVLSGENQSIDTSLLSKLAWGRCGTLHGSKSHPSWTNNQDWNLSIQNVEFLGTDREDPMPAAYSRRLHKVMERLHNQEDINILLLGDSITDRGIAKPHGYYMGLELTALFGVNVNIFNAAVGGDSVREGHILFPRSIANAPAPDLTVVFYGANDCKSAPLASDPIGTPNNGLTPDDFRMQIEKLIDSIRIATGGNCDVMLVTGVPRLDDAKTETTGQVEMIVDGIHRAAENKETALVDTLSQFLLMDSSNYPTYFADTIHMTTSGLQYLGQLLFDYMMALDSDLDGANTLIEAAMKTNPVDPQEVYLPELVKRGDSLSYIYRINQDLANLDYIVQTSTDLAAWDDYTGLPETTSIGPSLLQATVSFPLQIDQGSFCRLLLQP